MQTLYAIISIFALVVLIVRGFNGGEPRTIKVLGLLLISSCFIYDRMYNQIAVLAGIVLLTVPDLLHSIKGIYLGNHLFNRMKKRSTET